MERAGAQFVLRSASESVAYFSPCATALNTPSCRSLSGSASSLSRSRHRPHFPNFDLKHTKSRHPTILQSIPKCSLEDVSVAETGSVLESVGSFFNESRNVQTSVDSQFLLQDIPDSSDEGKFNWLAQWYPIAILKHLDKRLPYPVTILGRDLVMWWDRSEDSWQVFADVCPHRLAPLSEGRINEEGHLQCSYHGWAFTSSGTCSLIPQAPQDRLEVKDSKKACAQVYISQQHQGLLWVFMDRTEGSKERSIANPPPMIPVLDDPDYVYDMGMSDLSYSYESLIENLLDPAHVPFAHHKLQSNRKSAKPLNFRVLNFGMEGFQGSRESQAAHKFIAPCMSVMEFNLPPPSAPKGHPLALKLREFIMPKKSETEVQRRVCTVFYCVPTVPGKSRVFFSFPRNFAKAVFHWTPRWLGHLTHMTVLDSDTYLLHLMEHRLEDGGGMSNIEKLYYTPTASDAFVVSYRKWLKKFGGGVPDFGPRASDRPSILPKAVVLDRMASHVRNCTICSGTLRNAKVIELVLQVLPFILLGFVAASNVKPLSRLSSFNVPLICMAVVSSLASRWLSSWIKRNFEFRDYVHALVE